MDTRKRARLTITLEKETADFVSELAAETERTKSKTFEVLAVLVKRAKEQGLSHDSPLGISVLLNDHQAAAIDAVARELADPDRATILDFPGGQHG